MYSPIERVVVTRKCGSHQKVWWKYCWLNKLVRELLNLLENNFTNEETPVSHYSNDDDHSSGIDILAVYSWNEGLAGIYGTETICLYILICK